MNKKLNGLLSHKPIIGIVFTICVFVAGISVVLFSDGSAPAEKSHEVVTISGTIVKRDLDDLATKACLVTEGVIMTESDSFQIENPSGAIGNYTDYTLMVDSVLRGMSASDEITIRVQGGTVNGFTENYEESPVFAVGERYMLFLYQPARGGAFNTLGDYYYVLGLKQGVLEESASGTTFVSQKGDEYTAAEIQSTLEALANTPVDLEYFRNEYIANQERNLQTGFITEAEFEKAMQNLDVYATVVEQ